MNRRSQAFVSLVLGLALVTVGLGVTGCSDDVPDSGDAQLFGIVTALDDGDTPQLLVVWDETLGAQLDFDAASLAVSEDADVFRRKTDGSYTRIQPDDLALRDLVEVQITGPVRESYPVQADASQVVVVGAWDESKPLPVPPGLLPIE